MPDPRHVAIVMDGNGRWAAARDLPRTAGHAAGEAVLFEIVHAALDLGIEWLTVFTFSTENWSRSDDEVAFLMGFKEDLLMRRRDELHELGVRVRFLGDRADARVGDRLRLRISEAEELTAADTRMTMVFAFNYGSRAEIAAAARRVAESVAAGSLEATAVTPEVLSAHFEMPDMPDPDLVIRTSGEHRLSNFLLWQSAYSEFVFSDTLWPDFTEENLKACVEEYRGRERRFGAAPE